MSTQFPQSIQSNEVKYYLISLINPLNVQNTDSGTSSVTINETTGIAVFSDPANGSSITRFTINNSLVTGDSYIDLGLKYSPGTGAPQIAYYETTNGIIYVDIYNSSVTSTDVPLTVQFRIIA